ncbi:hypothetical protein D3C80_1354960 [compost metagenome]
MLDHLFQDFLDADARFGRSKHCFTGIESDHILDLLLHPFRVSAWQIDFVDDRQNFQVVVQRKVYVSQRLRFDPLGSVHYQQCAFTGRKATGDLIGEIDMPRCVNQVQQIILTVVCTVSETYGLQLNGDPAFTLQIHLIQHLLLHFA